MGAEQQQQQQTAKAAAGSRFAAAFGLLRQYMKEQPDGGMVTMGLMPGAADGVEAVAPEQRIRTMELFPQQAGMVRDSRERYVRACVRVNSNFDRACLSCRETGERSTFSGVFQTRSADVSGVLGKYPLLFDASAVVIN